MSRRARRIVVVLDDDELSAIRARAAREHLDVGVWLRKLALDACAAES